MTRKTFLTILILSITTVLSAVGYSYASPYKISQITNNTYDDWNPQINDNGYVVWQEYGGGDAEIFLYDGISITQITNNSYNAWNPQINNNGYVVWYGADGSGYEIFLYDGTGTTKITDNSYGDWSPQINNNGYVVWEGWDVHGIDHGIFLYDGTGTTQITDGGSDPQINDNGYVVWSGWDGTDSEIFLYDGAGITQITNNSYDDVRPQINNNGCVVWSGWDGTDSEIFLYDGAGITQITNNSYDDWYPQINNNGNVVWEGHSGDVLKIFLFDSTRTIQLISSSFSGNGWPQINDRGYVVWQEWDGSDEETEIFLYDGTGITQITENSYADYYPQINNKGDIVWNGFFQDSDSEIFIASPIVKLIYPNGSEIVPSGSTYTILWDAPKEAVKFDISYSLNNGATWNLIASKVTGSRYDWTVPKPTKNKKNCLVKVIGYDASDIKVGEDTSDGTFSIEVVKVTSPNGGENWKVGSTHAITWTTNGTKKPVANVKLFYTTNRGATWNFIRTVIGNPGSSNWKIPAAASVNCKVKVVLKDALGKTMGTDVSDRFFTIGP